MTTTPQIDYTDKDFASLRRALLQFAQFRLPEWTDRSPADLGMLLVDMFAYMGDVVLYYQDRIAEQGLLEYATERQNVVNLLRLIGYELSPPVAAFAEVDLLFQPGLASVTIPTGLRFRTTGLAEPQVFEYLDPTLTIVFASDQVERLPDGRLAYRGLPLRQGTSVAPVVIGSSTAEANQSFALLSVQTIPETVVVEVDEGAGFVRWDRRESLLYDVGPDGRIRLSEPDARHYYVRLDAEGNAAVHFGDGRFGRRPPRGTNNVRAAFRTGGGAAGNVPAGTIREVLGTVPNLDSVTNPLAASGGQDAEATADAKRFGPLAFRSRDRAVTEADYEAMAHLAGGVAKAHARARSWNTVDLYVAPEGEQCGPVPEGLRRRLLAFFEDRRMAGTFVRVLDAACVPIDISVEVSHDDRHAEEAVRQAVAAVVAEQLDYHRVSFGETVYLSAVHNAIEDVPGVQLVTITRFRRHDDTGDELVHALDSSGLPPLDELPEIVRRALQREVQTQGRIELAYSEIPVLGDLSVTAVMGPR